MGLRIVLLLDDNPAFEGLFEFCSISAGGSIGEYFTYLGMSQSVWAVMKSV